MLGRVLGDSLETCSHLALLHNIKELVRMKELLQFLLPLCS